MPTPKTNFLGRFARWLHTGWPAGRVERLPLVASDGTTAIPGVRIVGDLTGVPLLKLAADSGARAVQAILAEPDFQARRGGDPSLVDLAILGAGVSGISAALVAKRAGLRFTLFEATEELHTLKDFPKEKPIFTYPTDLVPAGELQITASVKEALVAELAAERARAGITVTLARVDRVARRGDVLDVFLVGEPAPVRALRVIFAVGRAGDYRRLDVPGESNGNVFQRLHDPADFVGRRALVVGGGDAAMETALALCDAGAKVTLVHRGPDLARAKEPLRARFEALASSRSDGTPHLRLATQVTAIEPHRVLVSDGQGHSEAIENDVVFVNIGRSAPLDLFRRSGLPIRGEWRPATFAGLAAFLLFCVFLFNWKAGGALTHWFEARRLFPFNLPEFGRSAVARTLSIDVREPGFYYSTAYSLCVSLFGARRIRRRQTPYVTRQTLLLIAAQLLPLYLIPYFILPALGHAGFFDHGALKVAADQLFPSVNYGQGREYWRSFGFLLAWPLFVWNLFTPRPMTWWIVIGCTQTFVLIPLMVWRWGKGAYCGFLCSCGALAETLGDAQREKMPHGPLWNRLNFTGFGILVFALFLFALRIAGWATPEGRAARLFDTLLNHNSVHGIPLDYYHVVDMGLAGIVGVGLYFWLSGRVWCRFACPLAALMHIYARFSRFRIFADKKKCISCNICTTVCHQGIDVMGFANKGRPMEDPECVRCSACVGSCPTGTLTFGRLGKDETPIYDRWEASPVQMRERRRLPVVY